VVAAASLHHGVAETIHVVEGTFDMTIDGERLRLEPGHTARVPPDVIHDGANVANVPGRRVVIFTPAGMERFFLEAGAPSEDAEVDPASTLASAMRHGWEFVAERAAAQPRP
jgi:hypothetical protein